MSEIGNENGSSRLPEGKTLGDFYDVTSVRMSLRQLAEIDDVQKRNRIKSRNEAIRQLVEVGLFVERKKTLAQSMTQEDFEAIKEKLTNDKLVDWIHEVDQRTFSIVLDIVKNEAKARAFNPEAAKWSRRR